MRKFLKNTKGAVTVVVTLLLIPAILVSGTAVDLTRIHTARSIVQDANQLAANSVLTQYDAMIQDIYGLFAVMESDPILGDMLNEYIKITVFGEDWQDKELGTFQLFYGSDVQTTSVVPKSGQNLRNPNVLRRQIEEYAKFRAPVIIIEEIWDRIEKFKKLKDDSEVIEQKMAIDDKIDEIDKLYKEIYNLINDINGFPTILDIFNNINLRLVEIKMELKELETLRNYYSGEFDRMNDGISEDDGYLRNLEQHYAAVQQNIVSLVEGGMVGIRSTWVSGYYNVLDIYKKGKWGGTTRKEGLNQMIEDKKRNINSYIADVNLLVNKCNEADKKKNELSKMVDDLESKLNNGNCSDDIIKGMTEPQIIRESKNGPTVKDRDGKEVILPSVIKEYRNLLSYELKPMAEKMKVQSLSHINKIIEALNGVGYGSVDKITPVSPDNPHHFISRINLKKIAGNSNFSIDLELINRTTSPPRQDYLTSLVSISNYQYISITHSDEFVLFQNFSTPNRDFYKQLEEKYSGENENEEKKNKEKNNASSLLKSAQEKFRELMTIATLTPEGAKYYKAEGNEEIGGFGNEGDWSNEDDIKNQTKSALNNSIISKIGDFFNDAANKILLITYDAEMFSNFTTVEDTKTMSGVPLSTDVNYFFQSELEYLYNGNEKSARSNIATVSGLILLVRFVFNYTSTFVIDEIKYELWLISAPAGSFAPLVRELARLGYALAESALDMKELLARPGRGVPLFKTKIDQWTFSLHREVHEGMDIPDTIAGFVVGEREDEGDGVYYIDYLRIFLLFKEGDILAKRTADLITWNITNKKEGIGADEGRMATADLIDMSQAHTDFAITTTVDMRMLFLSMPFAQKGINGVIPPRTMPVTVTDYRGY